MEWNPNDLLSFKKLISPEDDEPTEELQDTGSVLNPATATGGTKGKIADPNVKIEAKIYSKQTINPELNLKGEEKKKGEAKAKRADETRIWDQIPTINKAKAEGRPEPKFEVLPLQHIGTEDVFLGLSGKDPSTVHCDKLSVIVNLPGHKTSEVNCDLGVQSMCIQVNV